MHILLYFSKTFFAHFERWPALLALLKTLLELRGEYDELVLNLGLTFSVRHVNEIKELFMKIVYTSHFTHSRLRTSRTYVFVM